MSLVSLTDEELALLDGKVSDKVQREVNLALARLKARSRYADLSPELAGFIADVVSEAQSKRKLVFQYTSINRCSVCKNDAGYAKHKRSGRFHNKGDDNTSKPLSMGAVELADRFIRMRGRTDLGCCRACWDAVRSHVSEAVDDLIAEIPEAITGKKPKFKLVGGAKCKGCGWSGHELQMGMLPAIMGGPYHGECPSCGARNYAFGKREIDIEGDVLVDVATNTSVA